MSRRMTKPTKCSVHPAKTQISLGIRTVWSESLLCSQRVAKDPSFLHGDSFGWLCWGLTSQSTIFQSCRDGAAASWVINQYFRGVKCLAQGHNTAAVSFEPPTSRSGVRHSTTEPPRSPHGDSKNSDQTGWMLRLIWGFAGRTSFCWFCRAQAHNYVY